MSEKCIIKFPNYHSKVEALAIDVSLKIDRIINSVNYLGDNKYINRPSTRTLEFKFLFSRDIIDGLVELYQLQQHFQSGYSTSLENVIIYYDGKILTGRITDWTWSKNNPTIEITFSVYNETPLYKEEDLKYELRV